MQVCQVRVTRFTVALCPEVLHCSQLTFHQTSGVFFRQALVRNSGPLRGFSSPRFLPTAAPTRSSIRRQAFDRLHHLRVRRHEDDGLHRWPHAGLAGGFTSVFCLLVLAHIHFNKSLKTLGISSQQLTIRCERDGSFGSKCFL